MRTKSAQKMLQEPVLKTGVHSRHVLINGEMYYSKTDEIIQS